MPTELALRLVNLRRSLVQVFRRHVAVSVNEVTATDVEAAGRISLPSPVISLIPAYCRVCRRPSCNLGLRVNYTRERKRSAKEASSMMLWPRPLSANVWLSKSRINDLPSGTDTNTVAQDRSRVP